MNTKNNRRRRDSRERIESTFMEMLRDRELNEITVSEICARCGLNRSTFYANYEDIYHLADEVRANLEEGVDGLFREERERFPHNHGFLRLFRHMRDHQALYRTYFKLGYENQFKFDLYDEDMREAERYFDSRYIEYHVEFFRNGFNAIVKLWLNNGCRETPEEMERIVRREYQGRQDA